VRLFRTIQLRLRSIVQRAAVDAELEEELRDHIDRQIEMPETRRTTHAGPRCATSAVSRVRKTTVATNAA
jgi:hypothetical protein